MSATVLEQILDSTRRELELRKRERPLSALDQRPNPGPAQSLLGAIERGRMAVIAEFKRRSPSAGQLREAPELATMLAAYQRGGASAISVLTEGPHFDGSVEDLRAARAICDLPLLRKDFIIDDYQLHEALAAGADAVLLIVAALSEDRLAALHASAGELGLEALVEVHDRAELELALAAGARLIGINNRDLRDFSVDVERTARLMKHIPAGVAVVSESGIHSARQLERLHGEGVAAVLVGESLMRAQDPAVALRALLA
jgi:indole-3-glycerol phosphate synthase